MDRCCVWLFLLSLSLSHGTVRAQAEACHTAMPADIVFLVDESWSVGPASFQQIKEFISAIMRSFQDSAMGEEGTRFGVTVYGDIPRMRIALTDYSTLQEVLRAVEDLPYEGGGSRTGEALEFLVESVFSPSIARDNAPKIAVLITNGRSDDVIDGPAKLVADYGISLYAVGVRDADQAELRRIVTEPHEEHLLLSPDFSFLDALLPRLSRRVCFTASEPPRPVKQSQPVVARIIGPKDLQVSELSYSSLRLTWTPATGDVTGYRLLVSPLSPKGHPLPAQQRQIDLKGDVGTAQVTALSPKMEYALTVYAIYPGLIGDYATIITETTAVPQVANFRVMEEGLFYLRLGWTPPLGKLNGYKIFIPRPNRPGLTYEQVLRGDASSHVIDSLEEDKKYAVSIYAMYPEGPSEPVSVVGRTLKLVPVQQLLVQNSTTDTVQARWPSVRGASGYRLTWSSSEGHIENVNLGESYNFYMIQGLHPGTEYTVTINPIFGDIEGPITAVRAKTLENSAVQILRASAVSTSSAITSWNSVPGATGYRLAWGPTQEFVGRDRPRQLALNGSATEYLLKNLVYDTEYVLSLYVLFGSVVGPGITATFRTSPLGYVSNFKVTSYTRSSVDVEWSPVVGATEYKLTWSSEGSGEQGLYLDRSVLLYRIDRLSPQTTYSISIHALYGNTEGPEISLSQQTASLTDSELIQTVREVKVVDIGVNTFKLAWKRTPGVSGYKISWSPFHGGVEKSELVTSSTTSFAITGLLESSAYKLQVSSVVGGRESSPVMVTARTLDLPKVNGFVTLDITDDSTVLNWTSVSGASGYMLSWRHISQVESTTEILGPGFTSYKISELLYGRTYIFTIRPLYGEVEGPITTIHQRILTKEPRLVPVQTVSAMRGPGPAEAVTASPGATARNTRPPGAKAARVPAATQRPATNPSRTAARTAAASAFAKIATDRTTVAVDTTPPPVCGRGKADIVFLVDESWSIGTNNFGKLKDFLFRIVTYFPSIGPQGTQVAVVHYSDQPRIEFRLNDYRDRNSVLRALRGIRYGGGNTKTGRGISYVLQELFQESLGMRQDVSHVLVLLTDGRAQDDVSPPSRIAHALGVSVLVIGVANADVEELRKIASPTSYKNIFFASTFDDFPSIEREFISSICSEALLSEFKQHDDSAQLDTPTSDPEALSKPEGPCSQCMKGQKGEKGDGSGHGGLRLKQGSGGEYDPFNLKAKGDKGERGLPGTDGVPGFPGRPGRTGPPGSAGQRGSSGASGDIGLPGVTGPKGQRGERGEPGYVIGSMGDMVSGRKGEPGSSGPQGAPGVPGVSGPPGIPAQSGLPGAPGVSVKGDAGEAGLKGPRGKAGLKGEKGDDGKAGQAGFPGPGGIDGVPGTPGHTGEKGVEGIGIQGVQGPRGPPGEKGNVGLSGAIGAKGEAGIQGIQGVIGPRGKRGLKGEQGDKGGRGEIGQDGAQGVAGLSGPVGLKGNEGQRGVPGDPAKGILGPTGKKGARGDIGPVGPAGPQGVKGVQGDKGEKGSPGFGIPGQQGQKGESGERGNVGLSGKPGARGSDGFTGSKGNMGLPGNPGAHGLRGKDGISGSKGDSGARGEAGSAGQHGDRGVRGPLGLPGRLGDPGQRGDSGKIGLPGPEGLKGEPGKPGPPGSSQLTMSDNSILTRAIKGEPGESGLPGLGGDVGLPGPRGPEGKPGPPGNSLGSSGTDREGLDGVPGSKGDQGKMGDPGPRGEKGDTGRVGIAGMPGLPGSPGRPAVDGKRGLAGKDGERGLRGDDGKKGEKGDSCTDGMKGEPGAPGLPGPPVVVNVTHESSSIDDIRKAFPTPMGPPGAPGPSGTKGDKGERGELGFKGEKGEAVLPGKAVEMKDIEALFEAYGIRLPLLKALIDRLLQDGMEELLHEVTSNKRAKGDRKEPGSNVITEYTSSVTYDLSSEPRTDTEEEGQLPEPRSSDPFNETEEDPTLWGVTTVNREYDQEGMEFERQGGEITVEGDLSEVPSPNFTRTNSSSSSEKVGPGVPEVGMETTLHSQEDALKKTSGEKKKGRERGKGKGHKGRHKRQRKRLEHNEDEEEGDMYDGEEYSYEYEDELFTEEPLLSEDREHRLDYTTADPSYIQEDEVSTTVNPFTKHPDQEMELEVSPTANPVHSQEDLHQDVFTTTVYATQSPGDIEKVEFTISPPLSSTEAAEEGNLSRPGMAAILGRAKRNAPWPDYMAYMPGTAGGRNRYKDGQKSRSGARGKKRLNKTKQESKDPKPESDPEREEESVTETQTENEGERGRATPLERGEPEEEIEAESEWEREREWETETEEENDRAIDAEYNSGNGDDERSSEYEGDPYEERERDGVEMEREMTELEREREEELEMERERDRAEMEKERMELARERQEELARERQEELARETERERERDEELERERMAELERQRMEWERRREEMEVERGMRERVILGEEEEEETDVETHATEYDYLKGTPGESGLPGPKGEMGEKGHKGEPGIGHRGPVGQAGPPGQKGEPGEPGPTGAQGIQGIRGNLGIPGSQGQRGQPGDPGEPGREGDRGRRGKNGSPGTSGAPGTPGKEGMPGEPGVKGDKGDSIPGEPGDRGVAGLQGRRGPKGAAGVRGLRGHVGPKGYPGTNGEKGNEGSSGNKGERGSPLPMQGPRGYKGLKGDGGQRGAPGFDGDKGEKGEDGPPGVKGLKGEAGAKGAVGPFGARGPVGQKGHPGEAGVNGEVGHNGEHGLDGDNGDKGDMGLQGQKGDQGETGEPGLPGDTGVTGEKGLRGFPGRMGSPGLDGEQGEPGVPGAPGIPGLNGLPGWKGEKGDGGLNGVDGAPGHKGAKGATGFPGFPGFKGSAGTPGKDGAAGRSGPVGPKGEMGGKGERGRRGRGKPCQRGTPGTSGQRGENGELGPGGLKGAKGEPGLSVEKVKELVTQEVVVKCGKERDAGSVVKEESTEESVPTLIPEEEDERREGEEETTAIPPSVLDSEPTPASGSLTSRGAGACLEPMSEGQCSEYTLLWYYHLHSGECRPFVYGGCGGNRNRFATKQDCQRWCGQGRGGPES